MMLCLLNQHSLTCNTVKSQLLSSKYFIPKCDLGRTSTTFECSAIHLTPDVQTAIRTIQSRQATTIREGGVVDEDEGEGEDEGEAPMAEEEEEAVTPKGTTMDIKKCKHFQGLSLPSEGR